MRSKFNTFEHVQGQGPVQKGAGPEPCTAPPPVGRQTDKTENIGFPQLRWIQRKASELRSIVEKNQFVKSMLG